MPDGGKVCGNCRHWDVGPFVGIRERCLRYPPTVKSKTVAPWESVWPYTTVDDRCGEHQPRERDQKP